VAAQAAPELGDLDGCIRRIALVDRHPRQRGRRAPGGPAMVGWVRRATRRCRSHISVLLQPFPLSCTAGAQAAPGVAGM